MFDFRKKEDVLKIVESGDRELMIEWLEWNDKDGVYSDRDCDNEGIERMSVEECVEIILENVEEM